VEDDELVAVAEQVLEAELPFGPFEDVVLLDRDIAAAAAAFSASPLWVYAFSRSSRPRLASSHSSRDTTSG